MRDWVVKKRLKELAVDDVIPADKQLELLQEYKQDLDNGIPAEESEARAILILANEKLIIYSIKLVTKSNNPIDEESEVYFAGKMGLIDAVDKFNVSKNVKFSTYVIEHIRLHLLRYFHDASKARVQEIFYSEITKQYNDKYMFEAIDEDSLTKMEEEIIKKLELSKILKCFKYLSPNYQELLIKHLGLFGEKKKTFFELAVERNTSYQRIQQIINVCLTRLKSLLNNNLNSNQANRLLKRNYPIIPQVQEYLDNEQGL